VLGLTRVLTRYTTDCENPEDHQWAFDRLTNEVLFEAFGSAEENHNSVTAWLNKHYPGWEDPSYYWDDGKRPGFWKKLWLTHHKRQTSVYG
jgi:hypothetical protein